jgi:hypothetical protein
VFNAGTAVDASIFSDSGGTPKANPFVAGTDGQWNFWANPGSYDVQFSGAGIPTPYTLFNFFVSDTAITAPLPDPGANGVLVRTALQTLFARTITGTANEITVINGSGVAGNPTISLPSALTFTGKTITGGTYSGPIISFGTHTSVTSFSIRSSGAGFDTAIAVTEVLTANRTLTLTLNDANRTVSLGGNLTTANAFVTSGNFSLTLTTTAGTNVTLPTTGTLATLAGTETFTNKTLTSPRIGVALLDTNGNEVIETPATSSAVNQLRVTNSATGNPVSVSTQGDDANVPLTLATKGTGNFVVQTNGISRLTIAGADANAYFGDGVTSATPDNYVINATGGSGTNIAGAHLDLAAGKGTGNAEPGQVAVRYPRRTASGTTLQVLSTERFPVTTGIYTNVVSGTPIANTTTETSIFIGTSAGPGSTLTIESGTTSPGSLYVIYSDHAYSTTGTPTLRIKIKLGSTIVADTGAFNATTGTTNGRAWITAYVFVDTVGATATVRVEPMCYLLPTVAGSATPLFFGAGISPPAVDLTANQTIDITVQWGTASASNAWAMLHTSVERIR